MNEPVTKDDVTVQWVVLSMGDRPAALAAATTSLPVGSCLVVANGAADLVVDVDVDLLVLPENVGIPGGRDAGLRHGDAPIVGFLDDDAELRGGAARIARAFSDDPGLGAVALRLVDQDGDTARRHVPRVGGDGPDRSGDVALFLGGACAIRRTAYEQVGGYFTDLFYGHEEVEMSWRLVDAGWTIRYLADVEVFHPRTDIERHADGWELTGRNRVMIARRTLPWPIAAIHVIVWLAIGLRRAPRGESRRRYLAGWRRGWRVSVDRAPISWRGVVRLTRLRRPPIV
ncbi:MAG: glycosyltransferase [Ilumatobacter sp.]|uniref:glycosyltransferase family 2 protein n=1 Tax=Ilumatobacter sp. TaxID=1967498 RepID=UPI003C76A8FD